MSVETLARTLEPYETFVDTDGHLSTRILSGEALAERILADPGPLLAALAEAGVLEADHSVRVESVYADGRPVDRVPVTVRRYVTAWQEVQP